MKIRNNVKNNKMDVWVYKKNNEYFFSLKEIENSEKCTYVGVGSLNTQCYIVISKEGKIEPYCFSNKKTAKSTCKGVIITAQLFKEIDEEIDEENREECVVCYEECKSPLEECGHYIHSKCIANSGKSECCICRKEVKLNKELEMLCKEKENSRKKEIRDQENEESERVARELQQRQNRTTTISIGNYRCIVELEDEKEWTPDEFTMELCRVLTAIHSKENRIITTNSIVQCIPIVMQINSISFTTKLSTTDICNSISLISSP